MDFKQGDTVTVRMDDMVGRVIAEFVGFKPRSNEKMVVLVSADPRLPHNLLCVPTADVRLDSEIDAKAAEEFLADFHHSFERDENLQTWEFAEAMIAMGWTKNKAAQ